MKAHASRGEKEIYHYIQIPLLTNSRNYVSTISRFESFWNVTMHSVNYKKAA